MSSDDERRPDASDEAAAKPPADPGTESGPAQVGQNRAGADSAPPTASADEVAGAGTLDDEPGRAAEACERPGEPDDAPDVEQGTVVGTEPGAAPDPDDGGVDEAAVENDGDAGHEAGQGPESDGGSTTPDEDVDTENDPTNDPANDPAEKHDGQHDGDTGAAGSHPPGAWRRLGAELRPRSSRSQILAGVLCAALGFALVVQVQQSSSDQLSSARQDDLVRLLEEVTDRAEQLSSEVAELESTRDELQSGTNKAASALELAQERAASEGILSGRLPAEGPGVRVRISDPGGAVEAAQLFNVLEELRNAGAEVVAVNGVRLVTSTWFRDRDGAIVVDDQVISPPYEWTVIGDPATLDRALEIPGGALATVRTAGAEATTTRHDKVTVDAVREPSEPEYATPQEADR